MNYLWPIVFCCGLFLFSGFSLISVNTFVCTNIKVVLPLVYLESESSGRSISPSSTFASGSEVEIGDYSTIERIASVSSNDESEYSISTKGARGSSLSTPIYQKDHTTSSTSSISPGASQLYMRVLKTV